MEVRLVHASRVFTYVSAYDLEITSNYRKTVYKDCELLVELPGGFPKGARLDRITFDPHALELAYTCNTGKRAWMSRDPMRPADASLCGVLLRTVWRLGVSIAPEYTRFEIPSPSLTCSEVLSSDDLDVDEGESEGEGSVSF